MIKQKLIKNAFEHGSSVMKTTNNEIAELLGKDLYDKIIKDAINTFADYQTPRFRKDDRHRITYIKPRNGFAIERRFDYFVEADSGELIEYGAYLTMKFDSGLKYIDFQVTTQN